jgi:hypothetical protein
MGKANPLFIDSTKMTGDLIGTLIELEKVVLYESETLYVLITLPSGEVQHMAMTINDDLNYQTRVWLNHQKAFTYQFAIGEGEKRILESVPKQARAQHAIVEEWVPVLSEPGAAIQTKAEFRPPPVNPAHRIPEHAKSVASLLEKFGL